MVFLSFDDMSLSLNVMEPRPRHSKTTEAQTKKELFHAPHVFQDECSSCIRWKHVFTSISNNAFNVQLAGVDMAFMKPSASASGVVERTFNSGAKPDAIDWVVQLAKLVLSEPEILEIRRGRSVIDRLFVSQLGEGPIVRVLDSRHSMLSSIA